ncbi:hypothetical protein TNCV_1695661 [Trichonephila clavipes]|nr:hypothetical protein TNCV_1695661 [Trichonephila clavipes]
MKLWGMVGHMPAKVFELLKLSGATAHEGQGIHSIRDQHWALRYRSRCPDHVVCLKRHLQSLNPQASLVLVYRPTAVGLFGDKCTSHSQIFESGKRFLEDRDVAEDNERSCQSVTSRTRDAHHFCSTLIASSGLNGYLKTKL